MLISCSMHNFFVPTPMQEFNTHLGNLSEHHDVPKVGPSVLSAGVEFGVPYDVAGMLCRCRCTVVMHVQVGNAGMG